MPSSYSELTEADYATLKTDITVTNQAEFQQYLDPPNDGPIAEAYNAQANPDFWVWKTSLGEKEIYETVNPDNSKWNWATYKAQTVQDRDSWSQMFSPGEVDPSLQQTRDGWLAIFGGQGASQVQVNYLLSLSRRQARRIEALLHILGNGSTATPGNMTFEGTITANDVAHALRGVPLS